MSECPAQLEPGDGPYAGGACPVHHTCGNCYRPFHGEPRYVVTRGGLVHVCSTECFVALQRRAGCTVAELELARQKRKP